MAKIVKRTKKDGSCSYCIRVSNGYDRLGRQVMVNRTFTPPPGMTGKNLEKELQRQTDAFEQEVHAGVLLDASMKVDDLIERWFTEYAEKKLKPKTVYNYRRLVPRISAGLGQLKVFQVKPAHLMAFYSNLEEQGVREDSTYTATPALLERLPHGKRGQIAKAAGIGDDTMRNVYRGANVSQSTAEKVVGVVGLPPLQSVHRARQGRRQAQREHGAALSPDAVQRIHKGCAVGSCTGKPLQAGRSTQGRRDRRAGAGRKGRCPAAGSLTGCTGAVQRYHTACIVHRCPAERDLRAALV